MHSTIFYDCYLSDFLISLHCIALAVIHNSVYRMPKHENQCQWSQWSQFWQHWQCFDRHNQSLHIKPADSGNSCIAFIPSSGLFIHSWLSIKQNINFRQTLCSKKLMKTDILVNISPEKQNNDLNSIFQKIYRFSFECELNSVFLQKRNRNIE